MSDQGFMRNIFTIFGHGELYEGMANKPLDSITLSEDKETITFTFEDGTKVYWGVEGDCCSRSWIEHLTVPDDIKGQILDTVEDYRMSRDDDEDGYTTLQVYQTKLITNKGNAIVLEYRNESNGYYGGYVVRLSEPGKKEEDY